MIDAYFTIDNFITMPMPVLDESEQGYHLEQRLQVSGKSAADEKQIMIEFQLGDQFPETPGEGEITKWMEEGELLHAFCLNVVARPFAQKEDEESRKKYRRIGKEVKIGDQVAHLDTMIVYNGYRLIPVADNPNPLDILKTVHGAYKRRQRDYLTRRNAEKLNDRMAQIPAQVEAMKQRRAAQQQAQGTPTDGAPSSSRRRG
jgi:hypothetical protein